MKLIYKAGDITEAHIIAGLLRTYDIESHVGGYYLQGGVGDLAAFDFATIFVEDDDVEKAKAIIAEYEGRHYSMPTSVNHYPHKITTSITKLLIFIIILIIVFIIFYLVT